MGRARRALLPTERDTAVRDSFGFMNSNVSSEKPKGITVRDVATAMQDARRGSGKILIVAGPAVVHTGSRDYLSHLIRHGFVNILFAGNALATHDIDAIALWHEVLGISMTHGGSTDEGHEHHLRSINRIRRVGGIRQAVEQHVLTGGVMFECVRNNIPFLLAGSIRDDGPLPEVVTDTIVAQHKMRGEQARGDAGPDDRHHPALDRRRQPAAGPGEGRVRRHQPGHGHQAQRPRALSRRLASSPMWNRFFACSCKNWE